MIELPPTGDCYKLQLEQWAAYPAVPRQPPCGGKTRPTSGNCQKEVSHAFFAAPFGAHPPVAGKKPLRFLTFSLNPPVGPSSLAPLCGRRTCSLQVTDSDLCPLTSVTARAALPPGIASRLSGAATPWFYHTSPHYFSG